MKRLSLLSAMVAMCAAPAAAGEYHFISAELWSYSPAIGGPTPPFLLSSSYTITGKSFGLSQYLRLPGDPDVVGGSPTYVTGTTSASCQSSVAVKFTVEWIGDNDETPPVFQTATWRFTGNSYARVRLSGLGPTAQGYLNVIGAASPDGAQISFNKTWTFPNPGPDHTDSGDFNVANGGFDFVETDDGRIIGIGVFSIGLASQAIGQATANCPTWFLTSLWQIRELVSIGGIPVQ